MVYANGLYFTEDLRINLDYLFSRIMIDKKASVIIIDGGQGEGKSTLGIHIADYINSKIGLPILDIENTPQYAVGGYQFSRKIEICRVNKLPIIVYDEGGDYSKMSSMSRFNKGLNNIFDTSRAFKIMIVILLPNFAILDKHILEYLQIVRGLLHLKDRTKHTGNFYAYSLYRLLLLKYYMGSSILKNYAFTKVDTNYRGHFQDLTPERAALLEKVTLAAKVDIQYKSREMMEGLLTTDRLAFELQRSIPRVSTIVNKLGIQPIKKLKRVKYYHPDTLNLLRAELDKNRLDND